MAASSRSFPSTPSATQSLSSSSSPSSPTTTPLLPSSSSSPLSSTCTTASCSSPNIVVIDLATSLVVPDFHRFYKGPIESFHPTYYSLPDGSLVTPPLIQDITFANAWLLIIGAVTMFFLVNVVVTIRYIRKGNVKNLTLFYTLLASQTLGLTAFIPMAIPYFNQDVNCTAVGIASKAGITLSYSLLMTGILGVKAYRCLNNSVYVLIALAPLRLGMLAMLGLDIATFRGIRRLSGSCTAANQSKALAIMIVLQFVESFLICGCFLYAVWQNMRSPADHGRLSIEPVSEAPPVPNKDSPQDQIMQSRGWWDYVPQHSDHLGPSRPAQSADRRTLIRGLSKRWNRAIPSPPAYPGSLLEKSLPLDELSSPHTMPRTSSVIFAESQFAERNSIGRVSVGPPPPPVEPLRPPSVMSRISKYMPRMLLFKQVIKDELLYTTLVTVLFLAMAVLMLVGTTCNLILGPDGWITIDWVIVSLFTMHSFSRVVERHEREAILQHPTAWDPMYRAELEASRVLRREDARRAFSPVSVLSRHIRTRQSGVYRNLEGNHRAQLSTGSFVTSTTSALSDRPPSASVYTPSTRHNDRDRDSASRPWRSSHLSAHSVTSSNRSAAPTPDPTRPPSHWETAVHILPSPTFGDFSGPPSSAGYAAEDNAHIMRRPSTAPAEVNLSIASVTAAAGYGSSSSSGGGGASSRLEGSSRRKSGSTKSKNSARRSGVSLRNPFPPRTHKDPPDTPSSLADLNRI